MEQCSEQKKYWNLLKKLEQKERNTTQYVSPKNLLNHYKDLLNSKRKLDIPPDSKKFGKLDYPITSDELDKTKHILKKGKANGLDNINNEMILCFLEIYPHIILNLFNTILEKKHYN